MKKLRVRISKKISLREYESMDIEAEYSTEGTVNKDYDAIKEDLINKIEQTETEVRKREEEKNKKLRKNWNKN